MTKRLEAAAEAALTILEVGGNGEGWTINDAIIILRAGLGRDITDEDRARIETIVPSALEDEFIIVGQHEKVEWRDRAKHRGPAPWKCHACSMIGSGAPGDTPEDYDCERP